MQAKPEIGIIFKTRKYKPSAISLNALQIGSKITEDLNKTTEGAVRNNVSLSEQQTNLKCQCGSWTVWNYLVIH